MSTTTNVLLSDKDLPYNLVIYKITDLIRFANWPKQINNNQYANQAYLMAKFYRDDQSLHNDMLRQSSSCLFHHLSPRPSQVETVTGPIV